MLEEKMIELRQAVITQANLVEEMLGKCLQGLMQNKEEILNEIISSEEKTVNQLEIRIDELCMHILALYHPEAKDLRSTMMASKMTSDLERMADCAVNIAESALYLIARPRIESVADLPQIAQGTIKMVKDSIMSFLNEDTKMAKNVCKDDEVVDDLRDELWRKLIKRMASDPSIIERALHVLRIANNLEKIADISTNIAEETVFMARGSVIKHHKDELKNQ
jgi:phosphate transport system protein